MEAGGLSKTYISGIERGRRVAPVAILQQIASAFGISLDDLLAGATAELHNLQRAEQLLSELHKILAQLTLAEQEIVVEFARTVRERRAGSETNP
jgi:transcriptional regulator with XRE-family HTH domain